MTPFDPVRFNPLNGNPLRNRSDVERALRDSFAPLLPYFSPGSARVRLSATGAIFPPAAADLEGFARPLWGLVPLAAGGGSFAHWDLFRQGLANGTDPAHPEYWGDFNGTDQRLVELAAIGFALRLAPHELWAPLPQSAKDNLAAYLLKARQQEYVDNNWKFFRVLVDLGLERCGVDFDRGLTREYLDELDGFYLGDGWYRDGPVRRIDHYIPFAMHFYGLIYAVLQQGDDARAARYRERAALFAEDIRHWFDADGGALAFGRSLTYRFACGGIWGALAYAGVEGLPWGEIKGHYLRHLRWWAARPIADRDGVLSVGFGYPNLFMSESYNSAGSPYWAFKAFLPLALPETHPFWAAEELPARTDEPPHPLPHPGMVMQTTPGNVVALSSGQENALMRHGAEKYAKFAYSSRYAFSVEADERRYDAGSFDGMLALSDDDRHYRVREDNLDAKIAGDLLFSRWQPWTDVTVETWLLPAGNWHIRIHRITTPRTLHGTEGGFAVGRIEGSEDALDEGEARCEIRTATDISVIRDLGAGVKRKGVARRGLPNTNLIHPRALIPQLQGRIGPGTSILACAVLALPAGAEADAALAAVPDLPDLGELERRSATEGIEVTAMKVK
ncbi:DUF2264 domain-containing protein [Devosia sp.]|uniref:DUF2264 domain-containing protein n=1 Tax=Devosia sp. TaxID=1871048 RepID=UPI003A8D8A9D